MLGDFDLKKQLKNCGCRFTGQRSAILDVLVEHKGEHLSTEEIYTYVKENNAHIGIATVYRTLMLLERLGITNKLDFDDGFSRYELAKENEVHLHHHLICSSCGSVSEVKEDLLDKLEQQILEKNKFLVKNHIIKFYGLCENCRK